MIDNCDGGKVFPTVANHRSTSESSCPFVPTSLLAFDVSASSMGLFFSEETWLPDVVIESPINITDDRLTVNLDQLKP